MTNRNLPRTRDPGVALAYCHQLGPSRPRPWTFDLWTVRTWVKRRIESTSWETVSLMHFHHMVSNWSNGFRMPSLPIWLRRRQLYFHAIRVRRLLWLQQRQRWTQLCLTQKPKFSFSVAVKLKNQKSNTPAYLIPLLKVPQSFQNYFLWNDSIQASLLVNLG